MTIRHSPRVTAAILFACAMSVATAALPTTTDKETSRPVETPHPPSMPAPLDIAYPGTIRLLVDATDVIHGAVQVSESIPTAGTDRLTLLFPKWIPGNHAPAGPLKSLSGLTIRAGGRPVAWRRDDWDPYVFHLDIPTGATTVEVAYSYLAERTSNQGGDPISPNIVSIYWNRLILYPAGHFARDIQYQPSADFPAGWHSASALAPGLSDSHVDYPPVDLETLVDSPVLAGRYMRREALASGVNLDIAADQPYQLVATSDEIDAHRALVVQADRLFGGARHYDHYDFLMSLSHTIDGDGLEHQRSSQIGVGPNYFAKWKERTYQREVMPHEYAHSWNGKYRRPFDLWTPNFNESMGDSLLWVYEGQTELWGDLLQERSGLADKTYTLDLLAGRIARYLDADFETWRSIEDTTSDPSYGRGQSPLWPDHHGWSDYYFGAELVWVEADQIIRARTDGRRSLDDFARAFFGTRDGDLGILTYTYEDVVAALNGVAPFDWDRFLKARLYKPHPPHNLEWLKHASYDLVYTDQPGAFWEQDESQTSSTNLTYSIGLVIGKDGLVSDVRWGGPAFAAGLNPGGRIVAVNALPYDPEVLKRMISEAKGGTQPISMVVNQDDAVRAVPIQWNGGLRYPHLAKIGTTPGSLDQMLAPRK